MRTIPNVTHSAKRIWRDLKFQIPLALKKKTIHFPFRRSNVRMHSLRFASTIYICRTRCQKFILRTTEVLPFRIYFGRKWVICIQFAQMNRKPNVFAVRILNGGKNKSTYVWHLIISEWETWKTRIAGQKRNGSKINIYYAKGKSRNILICVALGWCCEHPNVSRKTAGNTYKYFLKCVKSSLS